MVQNTGKLIGKKEKKNNIIELLFDTLMLKEKQAYIYFFLLLTLTRFPEGKFKYHINKNCLSDYEKLS